MKAEDRAGLETAIREACSQGSIDAAATIALRGYGPEIFGFLVGMAASEQDANDAFSLVAERIWLGLARFAWASSFRTWAYVLARGASHDVRRGGRAGARGRVPLSQVSAVSQLEAAIRSETVSYLRTRTRDRIAELRDALEPDDRMLLVLRVDRELAWNDLARVMSGEETLSADALKREAARLRKRFQLVKEQLREVSVREGLLESDRTR